MYISVANDPEIFWVDTRTLTATVIDACCVNFFSWIVCVLIHLAIWGFKSSNMHSDVRSTKTAGVVTKTEGTGVCVASN